jgi:hypothetical protein
MRIKNLLFYIFLITIFASCAGTPTSKYEVSVDWSQLYIGNSGGTLYYDVEVKNLVPIITRGEVYLKISCYDGSVYNEKVRFDSVPGLSSTTESDSKHVDGKRVTKVDITDDEFYYR